jgi:hypothetical protein
MHLTDSAGQGRGAIRRSYPAPLLPLGLLLLLATAALALSHAVFPLPPCSSWHCSFRSGGSGG